MTAQTACETPSRQGRAFGALAHARDAGKPGARIVLVWQVARTVLRLGFSGSAALLVGRLVMDQPVAGWVPLATIGLLLAATLAGLVCDRVQASAETHVAVAVRNAALQRLRAMPSRQLRRLSPGTLTVSVQRHPEALAALVIGHRTASMIMAVGPLLAAAALLAVSWQAAVLVLVMTPVMIVFFALVGDTIARRAKARETAFGRLAGQFADRMRALPTVLANHALATEEARLAERLRVYAANTMGVLRVAFLNAGIIDFFASMSIAVLAVFLGLGHLKLASIPGFSNLELWQSLFILMVAPEYFAPFRRFSEQYHAKADGLAAAAAMDAMLDIADDEQPELPALARLRVDLPARGLVAIVGRSGAGKSTLLRRLAGLDRAPGTPVAKPSIPDPVWVATDSYVPEGTLRDAIAWTMAAPNRTRVMLAAGTVGLLDDGLLSGGLDARLEMGGANLSGGQRLRVAVARAALSGRSVIADEPTAKLDPATAGAVRQALVEMAGSRLVVTATHDPELAALASHVIDLDVLEKQESVA